VVARVAREVADLLHRFDVDRGDVSGLGVAIAGRLDARRLVMRGSLQATEWEQFALEAALEEALGLPVTLEHDYVCAALGEFWVGRVPATADFACFYMATGFGFGLILEGEVYRGSSHNAGEVGHVILDVDGPECWCGSRGCLEALAGPRTVVRRAAAQPELVARLGLTGREDDVHADFAAVASAAADGDLEALELVEDSAHYVAAAILSLTNVLDLDRIVLSGPGFADAAGVYVRAAQSAVAGLAFVRQVHPVTIELSQLGLKSAATGAATVALHGSLGRAAPAPRRGQGGDALRRRPRIALVGPAL
jgi:predicted NBD/HSP70 family sugar kinase